MAATLPCNLRSASLLSSIRSAKSLAFKPTSSVKLAVATSPQCIRGVRQQVGRSEARKAVVSQAKKGGKKGGDDAGSDVDKLVAEEKKAKADADDRMKKCCTAVTDNFNTIRTGRANPAILDRVSVENYGSYTPLKSVAAVSVPDASTLLITPFDKSSLKSIEKALNESDININPSNDGEKIRLIIPQLTQERRKELIKQASKFGEDGKVAIRNVRTDIKKKVDKIDFSKDAKKNLEDAIQKLTDSYTKKIDELVKAKSDELTKI